MLSLLRGLTVVSNSPLFRLEEAIVLSGLDLVIPEGKDAEDVYTDKPGMFLSSCAYMITR